LRDFDAMASCSYIEHLSLGLPSASDSGSYGFVTTSQVLHGPEAAVLQQLPSTVLSCDRYALACGSRIEIEKMVASLTASGQIVYDADLALVSPLLRYHVAPSGT
jgi:hypothetical protein